MLVRYADDLVAMCKNRREAERDLEALEAILASVGLEPKPAKTQIVRFAEAGEGLDFVGFHHRWVCSREPRFWHICFLARRAMQRARDRVRAHGTRSAALAARC